MTRRKRDEAECPGAESGGISGFLRSLLRGIPWHERAEDEITLSFDSPASGELRVENANGRTELIGEDRQDIEVVAARSARAESQEAARKLVGQIQVIADEGSDSLELEVEVPRRWNRHGSANLKVRIPRSLAVLVSSSNGAVCLKGLRAAARAHSSNGSVSVHDVVGPIEVKTSNGKISCSCTCGRLLARSSNRKIEVSEHRGAIDAMTSNGLIHASLEEVGREGIVLATSNGRIVLELPEKVDADVDMRVDNGIIRNARDFEGSTSERGGRVRGQLGRGGTTIRLRTSNGSISLR